MRFGAYLLGGHWPESGCGVERITALGRLHLGHEGFEPPVVDVLVHVEALGTDAAMSTVLGAGIRPEFGGLCDIRGGQNDERIGSTELEHRLFDVAAGGLGHRRA